MKRKKAVQPKPAPDVVGDAMLRAVSNYLIVGGWNVSVIGSPRIQQQPDARKFNYEFVLQFTGSKRSPSPSPATDTPEGEKDLGSVE